MPKMKTRKIVAKRFKITATGKIMRRRQNSRHLRMNKSKKAIRRYSVPVEVKGKWAIKIKKMMGMA
ncbi:50S ribosomal protein L35 [Candidatus Cerribacteria bacterium 'Amazon FNV 2010 28 9']|uniref:Large ribosomal subunit protein bL35 n=1 Tax=Candidatus Cerribacteria bacterium 'Amazon FNV 2010 28 9' TaxID=2081795 RepID=A0A317JSN4_9BACT|nr:MAG: 50S ribosomal protein L35 [Candidatus Cerribacteria bacterium 'Amazon FNV 2010 28 9']